MGIFNKLSKMFTNPSNGENISLSRAKVEKSLGIDEVTDQDVKDFDEWCGTLSEHNLEFKEWKKKKNEGLIAPRKLIDTVSEANDEWMNGGLRYGTLSQWLAHNKDRLSPNMLVLTEKEEIVTYFYDSIAEADRLWKKIVRTEGAFGDSAKELETLLHNLDKKMGAIDGYTSLDGVDMTENHKAVKERIAKLYRRQKRETNQADKPNTRPKKAIEHTYIDDAQRIPATPAYANKVIDTFYSDYPEKPFISHDREKNIPDWINNAEKFRLQMLVPKVNMKRLRNGLLPGHIMQLYWLENINRKRIPGYFEYQYGICFENGLQLLTEKGFLKKDGTISEKGRKALQTYHKIIEQH